MNKQLSINGELLLLCERMEMARFLHVYLQYLFRQGVSLPTLQILNYRSLEQLANLAERLPSILGSQHVSKVLIFADAQNDIENRRNMILDVRSSAFFRSRGYCAHFFFPGRMAGKRWRNGYMEDLLLQALKEDASTMHAMQNSLNVAREYLACVENIRKNYLEEKEFELTLERNRLVAMQNDVSGGAKDAYKSKLIDNTPTSLPITSYKFVNHSRHLLYAYFSGIEKYVGCTIAEAAKLGAFDFEHSDFAELKKSLLSLGEGE